MAQDPYGFRESVAPTAGGGGGEAAVAMWCGTAATMLAAVGPCSCYMTYLLALPLGIYAVYSGFMNRESAADAGGRTMALAGMVSGGLATVISALFVFGMAIYLVVIFAFGIAGALAGGH